MNDMNHIRAAVSMEGHASPATRAKINARARAAGVNVGGKKAAAKKAPAKKAASGKAKKSK